MVFLLFSCSLREGSRSRVMAEALRAELEGAGKEVEYLDLRDAGLPLCDGDDCYNHPVTKALRVSVAALLLIAVTLRGGVNYFPVQKGCIRG